MISRDIVLLPLFFGLMGCFAPATITSEQNQWVNLAAYRSYTWLDGGKRASQPELDARIRAEIEGQLARKGYRIDTVSKPDLFVTYQVTSQTKDETYTPPRSGHEPSDVITSTFSEGTLVVSMLDSSMKIILWRGTAQWRRNAGASLQQKEAGAQTIIARIFEKFPAQ